MGLGEPQPGFSFLLSQPWESQEEVAGLPLYVSDVETPFTHLMCSPTKVQTCLKDAMTSM